MITLTKEEAQQVLDAFLGIGQRAYDAMDGDAFHECSIAVSRLRARLAQPEPEPVAWMQTAKRICSITGALEDDVLFKTYDNGHGTPLYTAPQQRNWQGLTDEEANEVANSVEYNPLAMTVYEYRVAVQKATEAKLKEKNNG